MKKRIILPFVFFLISTVSFISCKQKPMQEIVLLPIKELVEVPGILSYQETSYFKVKFELPNSCYHYFGLDYRYRGNQRIVAIRAIKDLDETCTQQTIPLTTTFQVLATQRDDYVFKFWKGADNQGNDIFETVIIPVE